MPVYKKDDHSSDIHACIIYVAIYVNNIYNFQFVTIEDH